MLMVAGAGDLTADLVADAVRRRARSVFRFDTAAFPQRLGVELTADGKLRSPAWRDAFCSVARHVFVLRYLHDGTTAEHGSVPAPSHQT